ncbi:hypothetical protein Tsubulata_002854 [Turnera subulata]|uniref:DUF4283 domain-containing protein n=1 Tax=Turnera subulata TaxID=218843 RepID=A0A9Q0J5N1_9ROSI|nr:hypothetical protein Tsubulata_002854 [Turnera subulata]
MSPSPLFSATGTVCGKSSLVMDLGKLVLPNPNSSSALKSKGKSVISVQQLVSFASKTDHTLVPEPPDAIPSTLRSGEAPTPVEADGLGSMATMPVVSNSTPQLSFMKPVFNDDCSALCIPPELLEIGRKKYQLCLVGQFVGTAPKIGLIHAILNKLWGDGAISVSLYKDGLFLLQLPNEATYLRALSRGPWHVGGVPLMLWPWSSSAQKLDLSSSCFPVWLKLKHVPLELLTKEGLSYLASTLGTLLHTDRDCSKLFNNDCANVCVKVDFSKPLLHELKLDLNGEIVTIDVIYSWKPLFCDVCKNWGHHELACPSKKAVKKWIPKAISNDLASVSNMSNNAAVALKACPSKSSVIDVQPAVPTMQHTSVQPTDSVQKQHASSTDILSQNLLFLVLLQF